MIIIIPIIISLNKIRNYEENRFQIITISFSSIGYIGICVVAYILLGFPTQTVEFPIQIFSLPLVSNFSNHTFRCLLRLNLSSLGFYVSCYVLHILYVWMLILSLYYNIRTVSIFCLLFLWEVYWCENSHQVIFYLACGKMFCNNSSS